MAVMAGPRKRHEVLAREKPRHKQHRERDTKGGSIVEVTVAQILTPSTAATTREPGLSAEAVGSAAVASQPALRTVVTPCASSPRGCVGVRW